ncbi:MAG: zinc-dependent metalloprotease, partial [Chloroflexi bacterium]|nr:zinc-dependent metalloprotease [Chloroflexota bacterium]
SRFGPPVVFQQAARMMLSSQIGVLVGYLSRRVLGQYDIALLGEEPVTGGKLYFVEPNLRQVEDTLGVPPDQLRRWIALHEATHAHEFELYPWVRTYLNTSLRQYLKLLIDDMRGRGDFGENTLFTLVNRFVNNLRHGHNVINALMTPQQRELMSRLQALMSLAEGYSNHVMNQVGRELLPNFEMIHQRVEHRQRDRSAVEQLFLKITGLSLKMEQYRQGEHFVDTVARLRGIAFANRAWQSPEVLPTEAEIRDPEAWISRVEAGLAT